MKLRLSRRNILVTGITTVLLAAAAWAEEQHVIGFAVPAEVVAGSNVQSTISVNQGGVNVTVVSSPPGLVNQTITSSSGSTTASLHINSSAPSGSYQLIATPVGGGGSYIKTVEASNPQPGD